jgi:hypothetical protein
MNLSQRNARIPLAEFVQLDKNTPSIPAMRGPRMRRRIVERALARSFGDRTESHERTRGEGMNSSYENLLLALWLIRGVKSLH